MRRLEIGRVFLPPLTTASPRAASAIAVTGADAVAPFIPTIAIPYARAALVSDVVAVPFPGRRGIFQ